MTPTDPTVQLGIRFSSPEATATPWEEVRARVEQAEIYWLTTVRPDGRPHVTPLIAVWVDDRLWFCTGADERKARNLAGNPACALTTGSNTFGGGLDVVIEGQAVKVGDHDRLQPVAAAYRAKYGDDWTFTVSDGGFAHEAGHALVFEVQPATAFGFAKGDSFGQTRYRF